MNGLIKAAAAEFAQQDLPVNGVSPGIIDTSISGMNLLKPGTTQSQDSGCGWGTS